MVITALYLCLAKCTAKLKYMYYRLSFYLPWGGLSSIMMGDHKNLSHGSNTKCGHVALIWRWYGCGNQLQAYTKNKTDTGQPNKHWATELKKYIFYLKHIKFRNNKVSQIQQTIMYEWSWPHSKELTPCTQQSHSYM